MTCNIVQVVTFALGVSSALALTCYKCDSSQSSACNYGIGSITFDTVDCDQEVGGGIPGTNLIPKKCVKLVAKGKDGNEYVARGCMPTVGGDCKTIAKSLTFFGSIGGNDIDIDCFQCEGDKCNSATKFTRYTLLGVILAAFLFMF